MRRAGGEVCFAQVFRDGRGKHFYPSLFVLWSLKLSVWFLQLCNLFILCMANIMSYFRTCGHRRLYKL